jgi:uncharacterized protein (TIGR02246 family)
MQNHGPHARQEIANLCAAYTMSADRGRPDEVAAVFSPNAVFDIESGKLEGRDAIRAFFTDLIASAVLGPGRQSPARHHLTTSQVTFDDTAHASGRTYFIVVRDGTIIQSGIYVDRYILSDGQWMIGYRQVRMEYDLLADQYSARPDHGVID